MPLYQDITPLFGGPHVEQGIANGCPFCTARVDRRPPPGAAIVFLCGSDVGQIGVVSANQPGWGDTRQFCVKMNYGHPNHLRIVSPWLELFLAPGTMGVPDWMPPLSIEDACALHEQVLESLRRHPDPRGRKGASDMIRGIISRCWWERLPLSGEEVWRVLAAHGVRPSLGPIAIEYFDFGTGLLVGANGRKSVKRRRMPALLRGRYFSKKGREDWIKLFGHD